MSAPARKNGRRALCGSLLTVLQLGLVVSIAAAQEIPVAEPERDTPEPAPADRATLAPSPPTAAELAADNAELRAEFKAFKAKQEDAEAEALLAQTNDNSDPKLEADMLRIYGFTDFGLDKYFFGNGDQGSELLRPTGATTFVFGNLNLYLDATPLEHLRTMIELRFTLAPNGEEVELGPPVGISYQRTDTTTFDFSSPSAQSQLRLGGLYIERAWTEYQFSDLLKVQWGLFLNPFGIWNLDHGSPTLISLMLPTFIASQMVPTRLLGVHVHGSMFFGSSELGYALHVTNGRTPLDFDLSEDKALGARLYFAHDGDFGRWVLGASGYWGTYLDQEKQITPAGPAVFDWVDTVNYTEEVLGFDAALDVGDLLIRSEAVFRWVTYKNGKSEQSFTQDGSVVFLPNRLEYAAYLIAAYRTPWRVEPYLEGEVSSKSYTLPRWGGSTRASSSDNAAIFLSAGFNIELLTHMLFKTQVVWSTSYDRDFKHKIQDFPILFIRLVDSF